MPRVIDAPTEDRIELAELIERLETEPFDTRDEDNFASWGEELKKLANNRSFLGDIVVAELKEHCRNQVQENQFTPQVILLHGRSKKFIMRANFWPGERDSVVINSGLAPFFYHLPHDHNFSFLTVGYMGPGYWSEYYEYDYEDVVGYEGEQVDLKFVERSRLEPGKVMLYRAHRDVHKQLPADEMSISLNIVEASYGLSYRDQYRFDTDTSTVHSIISVVPLEQMLALTAHVGGEEGLDLLESTAASHPNDRVRFFALKSQASTLPTVADRIALFEKAARQDNVYLAKMAAREAERLAQSRDWIEAPRLQPAA